MKKTKKGLNRDIVRHISQQKNEPKWMTQFRLQSLDLFESMPLPQWGCNVTMLDPNDIHF